MRTPRLTLDTNCVINLFDTKSQSATSVEELQTLIRYAFGGRAEIAATTRLESDLDRDKNEERRSTLIGMLNMFPIISSILRWDVSRGDEDLWPSDGSKRLNEEIQKILSPGLSMDDKWFSNKINDIDHLTGHMIDKRDVFVTDDIRILRKKDQLRGLGIIVMSPQQCVAYIDEIVLRSAPKTLPSDSYPPQYHSRALQGTVTFDYTNNNGRYAIGEGQHLFETAWTKSSNISIHAYSDEASIDALAIAKNVISMKHIIDAGAYDYSSRVRTAQLGQIVIWRNVNGLYAATKILKITDDTRGDDNNELTLEYVIFAEGDRDFSVP